MYLIVQFGPSSNATPKWTKSYGWKINMKNGDLIIFNENNNKVEKIGNMLDTDIFSDLGHMVDEFLKHDAGKEMIKNPIRHSYDSSGVKYMLKIKSTITFLLAYNGDTEGHLNSKWAINLAKSLRDINENIQNNFQEEIGTSLIKYLGN